MKRLIFSGYIWLTIAIAATVTFLPAQSETKPTAVADYGALPLSFEANRGQSDPSVDFLSHGQGYTLFLRHGGAVLAQSNSSSPVEIRLADANPNAESTPEDPQLTRTSYFLGSDSRNWRTSVPNYGRIRYTAIYPGIDLVYYGNQRRLEHDFIVAPHADPAQIALEARGTDSIHIDSASGDIVMASGASQLRLLKPFTYQQSGGVRTAISSSYKLVSPNKIAFVIGNYDSAKPLIIDPVLVYSTYLGGSGSNGNGDTANSIAVDSTGAAYIVGVTYSSNFPISSSTFQSSPRLAGMNGTVFVSKLNPAGTALVYSTYIGGSAGEAAYGIALDADNNAYITGTTSSIDFPVTCSAFQQKNHSAVNHATTGFVAELNSTGTALVYSTFLGGTSTDVPVAIAVNTNKSAYVTGYTESAGFPVTPGAFQSQFSSGATNTGFVSKLSADGSSLEYSTFLGGFGTEVQNIAQSIAVNSSGDAFIAGYTSSTGFPVTSGAFQTTNHGLSAFLTELNSAGTHEVFSTFLGGTDGTVARAVAVDSFGFPYIAGYTYALDLPVTAGVVQGSDFASGLTTQNGEGFVAKFSQDGRSLVYSTYVEGQGTFVNGLAVDASGNAYLTGYAAESNVNTFTGFATTADALTSPVSGGNAAFVVELDPAATVFQYATLLGGSSQDRAFAIALDASGNAYVTGYATSTDFPTASPFQGQNNAASTGARNAFVSKFNLASEANQTPYPPSASGIPTTLTVVSETFGWGICGLVWGDDILVNLSTGVSQPPPTGVIAVDFDGGGYTEFFDVFGQSGGVTQVDMLADPGEGAFPDWTASYSGDSVYQGSSTSGSAPVTSCDPNDSSARKSRSHAAMHIADRGADALVLRNPHFAKAALSVTPVKHGIEPKFAALPFVSAAEPIAEVEPLCTAYPKLAITVHNISRVYGQPNPALSYSMTGLLAGDNITVTLSTIATQQSSAGSYPITAQVTGSSAANYAITVINGTLSIRKASLKIGPMHATQGSRYGSPISTTAGLVITGYVNGDNESTALTGTAGSITTTATSASPAGLYPLTITPGTLASTNYALTLEPGRYYIYKAPLTATIQSVSITEGQPIPAFTFTFTGFVNSDNAATAVTGSPILTTSATSASLPGKYKITATLGTLASPNYTFSPVYGTLTILP